MTRIRIIIPAAAIERTKLYLVRGAVLLFCVLVFPLAAHASPFDSGIRHSGRRGAEWLCRRRLRPD
jgi:hypothetical protein